MPEFDSQAQPFLIRVLDGPFSRQILMQNVDIDTGLTENLPAGVISLQGRGLPYRPIIYEGKQRVKTTWYPGNPVATQQVLGPTEEPTTINGMWKDRFLGNGRARFFMDLFEALRRTGAPVEVRWGQSYTGDAESLSMPQEAIVRRGIINNTKFTIDRPQDIAWEVTFEWRGSNEVTISPFFATPVRTAVDGFGDLINKINGRLDEIESHISTFATAFTNLPFEASERLFASIAILERASGIFLQATQALNTNASLPAEIVEQILGNIDSVMVAGREIDDIYRSNQLELSMLFTSRDDAFDTLEQQSSALEIVQNDMILWADLYDLGQAVLAQTEPDVIAEVRVPAGVDLRDLAIQFYGDPDAWWLIANFNNLSSSGVPAPPVGPSDDPGFPIRIPRLTNGVLGDIRQT